MQWQPSGLRAEQFRRKLKKKARFALFLRISTGWHALCDRFGAMNQNNTSITHQPDSGREGILHGFNTARRITALALGLGISAFLSITPVVLGDDGESVKNSESKSATSFSTPSVLTEKMSDGGGSINLLKDINASDLQAYLQKGGSAYLGVNLNEESRGKGSGDSVGAAIKSVELVLTTTTGTVSFKDFYTGCTAELRESGSKTAEKFQTLLGKASKGSENEKSNESGSSKFDDVLQIRNVQFTGTLLSAKLEVSFLKTEDHDGEGNESFFNYSGGDKEFALINESTAKEVKKQTASTAAAPSSGKFEFDAPSAPVPGAPAPPLGVLAMLGGVLAWKARRRE